MKYSDYYCANGDETMGIVGYSSEFSHGVTDIFDSPDYALEDRVKQLASLEGITNEHAISFLERSMAQFERWTRHPCVSVCQISAYKDEKSQYDRHGNVEAKEEFTRSVNQLRNKEMRKDIDDLGYSAQLVKGSYIHQNRGGAPAAEMWWSWLVVGLRGREMDADRRTTPEGEFEKEMLYLARKHGQESVIMTTPSRGIAHLSFTNEEETSLQLTRAGFGAGAFQRLKNSTRCERWESADGAGAREGEAG